MGRKHLDLCVGKRGPVKKEEEHLQLTSQKEVPER